MFDDIPEECKHRRGRLTKSGCRIVCSSCDYIIDHDDCVNRKGRDAIVVINQNQKRCIIVEAKGGRIETQEDAEDIVRQLQECSDFYGNYLADFDVKYVLLKGKNRLDDFVRRYIDKGSHKLKGSIIKQKCGFDLITLFS